MTETLMRLRLKPEPSRSLSNDLLVVIILDERNSDVGALVEGAAVMWTSASLCDPGQNVWLGGWRVCRLPSSPRTHESASLCSRVRGLVRWPRSTCHSLPFPCWRTEAGGGRRREEQGGDEETRRTSWQRSEFSLMSGAAWICSNKSRTMKSNRVLFSGFNMHDARSAFPMLAHRVHFKCREKRT